MKTEIETALFDAVLAFQSDVYGNAISFPNVSFDQPEDGNFIEVIHAPNTTTNQVWDDGEAGFNQGFLRLLVHYPRNIGTVVPQQTVDQILNYFPKGTKLPNGGITVKVYRPPWSNGAVVMDDERFIPVIIPYQVEG